jgi:magnesium chelatase family protein
MLARRCPTILPAMTLPAVLETTRLHRVAGRTGARTAWVTRAPVAPRTTPSPMWG